MTPPYGSLPSPLDEAVKARFEPKAAITFKVPLDEPTMAWWHEKLGKPGLYPDELAEALTGGVDLDRRFEFEIEPDADRIRLVTQAFDGEVPVFTSGRSLEFDRGVVHLDKTTIENGYRGQKVGSRLLGNAYRLLRQIGFGELELLAAWDGAYVWARAGFLISPKTWAEKDRPDRLRQPIRERVERIGWSDLPPLRRAAVLRLLDRDDPAMLWDFVEIEGRVTSEKSPPDRVKLPWSLLAETDASWYGRLPLSDPRAVARLEAYLRRNAAI